MRECERDFAQHGARLVRAFGVPVVFDFVAVEIGGDDGAFDGVTFLPAFVIGGDFFVTAEAIALDFEVNYTVGEDAVFDVKLARSSKTEPRHGTGDGLSILLQIDARLKSASTPAARPSSTTPTSTASSSSTASKVGRPAPGSFNAEVGALGFPIIGLLFPGPVRFDFAFDGFGVPFAGV